jgi:hypothetical protein
MLPRNGVREYCAELAEVLGIGDALSVDVLADVDFGALTETQVEPIYEAWLKLSDDTLKEMEQDFQDIDALATEGGSKAILDEARWHGEDLAEQFASLTGFHEHAFWDHP